jgi:hypothetical protein
MYHLVSELGLNLRGRGGVRMMRTSSGVTVAKAQLRRDTLMQVLPRLVVVGQHNVGAFE